MGSTASAFIRLSAGTDKGSAGDTTSTGDQNPNVTGCGLQLTDTDEITFNKNTSTSVKVIGEVWRYTGSSGGANEFIVRGHYAVSVSSGSGSQAVSGISDEDACVPIITGYETSSTSVSEYHLCTFAAYMDGSGNVAIDGGHPSAAGTVYVSVVEFTGSNWSVGHGISSSHDSAIETVTLNTDADWLRRLYL